MAVTTSTDAFRVYRGEDAKISDIRYQQVTDGNVYFAYDSDAIYFDAQGKRHKVAGGGDVSFIKCEASPTEDGAHGFFLFNRTSIQSEKLEVDNVILNYENSTDILYRVINIREGTLDELTSNAEDADTPITIVETRKIVGGGDGSGTGGSALSIVELTEVPERLLVTQPLTFKLQYNSRTSTDQYGRITVKINGVENSVMSSTRQALRTPVTYTIPANTLKPQQTNTIEITLHVAGQTDRVHEIFVIGLEANFEDGGFNQRRPFGTDDAVQKYIEYPYTFRGLDSVNKTITGLIRTYLDDEELYETGRYTTDAVTGQRIGTIVQESGTLRIPCDDEAFEEVRHGMHTIRFDGYVVINGVDYPVQSHEYEIIWATAEGGTTPIIISSYPSTSELENYNVIEIPYVIYAKNQEKVETHLYLNNEELATSPIMVDWQSDLSSWNIWRVTNYTADLDKQPNALQMIAGNVSKTFSVTITSNSTMNLDPVSKGLMLYLTAKERSNKETLSNRQTWTYGNYTANLTGFNWYNNGWTLDDSGDEVLRLSNGARVEIPFGDDPINRPAILQTDDVQEGFGIEVEFRCRNATSFAKLMTLQASEVQDTDEHGNLLWEMESFDPPQYTNDLDEAGNPIQITDNTGHPCYTYEENGETYEVYVRTDELGNNTYLDEDGQEIMVDSGEVDEKEKPIYVPKNFSNIELTPLYRQKEVMKHKLVDPNGADNASNWVPIMISDGVVVKNINLNPDGTVQNAVGHFFGAGVGFCIGTQEAFFASSGKKVNVRYADGDKVKVSFVADPLTSILYVYINGVLSGIERYSNADKFQTGAKSIVFNSDYCDLDLYNIRIYNQSLSFDDIVKNWIADAPNLDMKRERYLENHITATYGLNNAYTTIDYEATKALSDAQAEKYAKGESPYPGLPIMVISTYPTRLSGDSMSDYLPYNKANKKYVDIRYYDPNDKWRNQRQVDADGNEIAGTGNVDRGLDHYRSFKSQNNECTVQGTSSQGYPRRNFKVKLKATDIENNSYADKYPWALTTWDGNENYADVWPSDAGFESTGYSKIEDKALDIGNGILASKFCLKADYMDSSSSHNTPLANYVDALCQSANGYNLLHPMRRILNGKYSSTPFRTTVYGFPILIFWDHKGVNTKPEFVGRYNFNTDKSATETFGFNVKDEQPFMAGKTYISPLQAQKKGKWKNVKDDNENLTPVTRVPGQTAEESGDYEYKNPTYEQICECWELTSNQHGFTGFRRNDFEAVTNDNELDFYNFFESRYHVMDFDPSDVYKSDNTSNKSVARAKLASYAKNIWDLSRWLYSTDTHPWDNQPAVGTPEYTEWNKLASSHKLTQVRNASDILVRDRNPAWGDDPTYEKVFRRDYYLEGAPGYVIPIPRSAWSQDENENWIAPEFGINSPDDYTLLFWDEVNAELDEPVFYQTLDSEFVVTLGTKTITKTVYNEQTGEEEEVTETVPDDTVIVANKPYYLGRDLNSAIPAVEAANGNNNQDWYHRKPIYSTLTQEQINAGKTREIIGYETVIYDPANTANEYKITDVYEMYLRDTKTYRLSKYRDEFSKHLNFYFCAMYFILTELFILYDSREKNMMIATWGPEEEGGEYIWYPIFYDMDTQLGINNSGTVYWDYDVNAQDDGIFSGAGSVLWDNFYACFLPEIKEMYRNMRNKNLNIEEMIRFYNTQSADNWTPIMKNVDAFYKYIAPSITSLGYINQDGKQATRSDMFYCAQGDRTLNRSAFFRNRLNYKDSEWLGGAYRTQGGQAIQMRYDANWQNTSDPDNPDRTRLGWTTAKIAQMRADGLDASATFEVRPYLTQYCTVFYDEIPVTPQRYDIQKDTGYVTLRPTNAIQQAIDAGLSLSQQLAYIYGPEYVRDLGDLSNKYLDEFLASGAIRLNRLQLGNDNANYFNAGINDKSFNLDTAYEDQAHNLNHNAKALLEYIDLSNLTGLTSTLDVTGCLKLKTLRALGTNYTMLSVPAGNVLHTMYIPKTVTTLILLQSQALVDVIRDKNNCITATAPNNEPVSGLYFEGITDHMNVASSNWATLSMLYNGGISRLESGDWTSSIYETEHHTNAVAQYQVSAGKLGFYTYEILQEIVQTKLAMFYDPTLVSDTSLQRECTIRLTDVDWSPYHAVEEGATAVLPLSSYYVRNEDQTYTNLSGLNGITFDEALRTYGAVYTKNSNKLVYDPNESDAQYRYKEGLPDLSVFDIFFTGYNDTHKNNSVDVKEEARYLFKDTYIPTDKSKRLPTITGEVYVDNTTAIDEYYLYQLMTEFNKYLTSEDTPLTICAKTVTPCPRATFIEVMQDTNIQRKIISRRCKTSEANTAFINPPNAPLRNHYDFQGWTTDPAVAETYSQVADDSAILTADNFYTVETENEINYLVDHNGDRVKFNIDGGNQHKFYAVYTLHKYLMKYIMDEEKYALNDADTSAFEIVAVPSGERVGDYPPTKIPWKTADTGNMYTVWHFDGWGRTQGIDRTHDYTKEISQKNLEIWPVWTQESVYKHPLDSSILDVIPTGSGTCALQRITRKVGGKVCIPKNYVRTNAKGEILEQYAITSIVGPNVTTTTNQGVRLYERAMVGNQYTYGGQITSNRQGYEDGTYNAPEGYSGNGLQLNNDVTHLFFEGADDGTSVITSIGVNGCEYMFNLVYMDLPASLTVFDDYAMLGCTCWSPAQLPYITYFGSRALSNANTATCSSTYETNNDLQVSGQVQYFGDTWIGQAGWNKVTIGSPSDQNNLTYFPTFSGQGAFTPTGSNMIVRSSTTGLHYIYIYSSTLNDRYLEEYPDSIVYSSNRGVGGQGIEIRFNPTL